MADSTTTKPTCACGCGKPVSGVHPYGAPFRWQKVVPGHWDKILEVNTMTQAEFARKYGISRTMAYHLFHRKPGVRCRGLTLQGKRCQHISRDGSDYCAWHVAGRSAKR